MDFQVYCEKFSDVKKLQRNLMPIQAVQDKTF